MDGLLRSLILSPRDAALCAVIADCLEEIEVIRLTAQAGHVILTLLSPPRRKDGQEVESEYEVELLHDTYSVWQCVLTRVGLLEGYVVTLHNDGHWSCSCPAHKFRKPDAAPCKHISAAIEIREILTVLQPQTESYPCPL